MCRREDSYAGGGGAVECLVGLLRGNMSWTPNWIRESCLGVLYALSYGGLRFKGKEAGVVETLMRVEKMGSERARKKAMKKMKEEKCSIRVSFLLR